MNSAMLSCLECGDPFCEHCCDDPARKRCDPCFYEHEEYGADVLDEFDDEDGLDLDDDEDDD